MVQVQRYSAMLMASDMYIPVYDNGLYARIDVPYQQPTYDPIPEPITKNIGDGLTITIKSSRAVAPYTILFNGLTISSRLGKKLNC